MLRRKATGRPMPEPEMLQHFVDAYSSILRKPRGPANEASTEVVVPQSG